MLWYDVYVMYVYVTNIHGTYTHVYGSCMWICERVWCLCMSLMQPSRVYDVYVYVYTIAYAM